MKKRSLLGWRARPRALAPVFPGMYTMGYLTEESGKKEYGMKVKSIIATLIGEDFEFFVETVEECEKLGTNLLNKFKTDPSYLDALIKFSEEKKNSLYEYLKKNLNENVISTLTNDELAKRYSQYIKKYIAFHLKQTPSWWIATPAVEKDLRKLLSAHGVGNLDQVIPTLIDPLEYQSENFREELDLLTIAEKYKRDEDITSDLKKHTETFGSIPFGYITGVVWNENYFKEKIKEASKGNPEKLKASKLNEVAQKIKERDKLVTTLKLTDTIMIDVIALRKLAYLQELKKTTQTRSHPLLQLVVHPEIAKRLSVDKKYMQYIDVDEITSALKAGALPPSLKNDLPKRDNFAVLIIEKGKSIWLVEDEAKEFIKVNEIVKEIATTDTIKGAIASRGYARGHVKVCISSVETHKVEDGDVLVTAMTTPDFVPAMRKAAAIVTNEGGVTCHAAIVSRELNKPCIIGTKIATKVLKDGDMVEVDAEKGIVKIISK